MQLTIQVTEEDIREGWAGLCNRCPVALALSRAPGCPWNVGGSSAAPRDADTDAFVRLPDIARRFIERFDGGDSPEPFTFTVDIPKELESYIKVPA